MKKAKEYYAEIKPALERTDIDEVKTVIAETLQSLLKEVGEIAKMRNARSNEAMLAIIEEQNNKWNAICRRAEKDGMKYLREDGVKLYIKKEGII